MEKQKTSNRYSPEVRERAVRILLEHRKDHASEWEAIGSIAAKIGCTGDLTEALGAERCTGQGKRCVGL